MRLVPRITKTGPNSQAMKRRREKENLATLSVFPEDPESDPLSQVKQMLHNVSVGGPKIKPKDYLELQREWNLKLKESGFVDIEDAKNRLKTPDSRTQNFQDREALLNFFLELDCYLQHNDLPEKHRRILELYSQGLRLNQISIAQSISLTVIKDVISKYKKKILMIG